MTLLIAVLSVFSVLACHWLGLLLIRATFAATLARLGPKGSWGEDLTLGVVILLLVAWLFLDVAFCALIITLNHGGEIGFDDGFLFAIASFSRRSEPDRPRPRRSGGSRDR